MRGENVPALAQITRYTKQIIVRNQSEDAGGSSGEGGSIEKKGRRSLAGGDCRALLKAAGKWQTIKCNDWNSRLVDNLY